MSVLNEEIDWQAVRRAMNIRGSAAQAVRQAHPGSDELSSFARSFKHPPIVPSRPSHPARGKAA